MTLYPTDTSEYTAQVYAGLFDLRARGEIDITLRRLRSAVLRVPHSVYLECRDEATSRTRRIFIDLVDAGRLREPVLGAVDVYVKRSLRSPPGQSSREAQVIPYGLQFAARTPAITAGARAALHWQASFRGGVAYSPLQRLQAAASAAGRLLRRGSVIGQTSPHPLAAIESSTEEHKTHQVFFATRVYAPEEAPEAAEREAVNHRRVELIRALKAAFGDRFVGGLRPSAYAVAHFPDCVYRVEDNHAWHYRTGKQSLIHVNSTGLHGSTGWKFAEALAQQSCLVTEPCLDHLPEPLVDGVHYLVFDNVDTCVRQCRELLADPARAQAIRSAGHAYYLGAVQPEALMRSVLRRAFTPTEPRIR